MKELKDGRIAMRISWYFKYGKSISLSNPSFDLVEKVNYNCFFLKDKEHYNKMMAEIESLKKEYDALTNTKEFIEIHQKAEDIQNRLNHLIEDNKTHREFKNDVKGC